MTLGPLSRLVSRLRGPTSDRSSRLTTGHDLVQIVGDIHGNDRCLAGLLQHLNLDAPLVFVGDAIDRGPNSRPVLNRLRILDTRDNVTCLMGNHEAMLLSFLDDPARQGSDWLEHGGLETLRSFSIDGIGEVTLPELRDRLYAALGPETVQWLRTRPAFARFGNLVVVHAGADPDHAPEDQPINTLVWGHPRFGRARRSDGLWIAHGHTVVEKPFASGGRIAVDTGAWRTGRLTAARVTADGVSFISTKPD